MGWIKERYQNNIYGIMGTLVFHICLVLVFVLADIDKKGEVKDDQIIIEFPYIIPEIEEPNLEQKQAESNDVPSENNPSNNSRLTNRASNQTVSNDEFFDSEYEAEIKAAQQLVSDVNSQLQKDVPDFEDLKMPVETTEGMDPDSIKNKLYSGESNIYYSLENRYHLSLPIPIYLAQGGGKIIVNITVDRRGYVTKSSAQKNSGISDPQIYYYAELAAKRTVFNSDSEAPTQQKGTITYNFLSQ